MFFLCSLEDMTPGPLYFLQKVKYKLFDLSQKKKKKGKLVSFNRKQNCSSLKVVEVEWEVCCCCVASVVSDSVRPHRWQPTGLPRPWDSPGKNTRVGCHFLLQCMKVKSESEVAQSCPTLSNPMDCSLSGSSVHGIFQARVLEWGAIAFSACPPSPKLNNPSCFVI